MKKQNRNTDNIIKSDDSNRRKFIRDGAFVTAAAVLAPAITVLGNASTKVEKVKNETTDYDPKTTALLCIDFYNDFLSEGGKRWESLKEVANEVGLLDNLHTLVKVARESGIMIFHVPHHRWEPGDYEKWKYPTTNQRNASQIQPFAKGTWGGTFHDDFQVQPGDVLVSEHWAQSGFANTNLEHLLRRNGIEKIICIGLIANTCIESTARYGSEMGFYVTLVKDATSAVSKEAMHAAHNINGPTFAHEITTTAELVKAIKG